MILVSGAAGKTGQAVTAALAARGKAVRAWVRRPQQVAQARQQGTLEVVTGDMLDAKSWRQAMQGVTAVYHICPNMSPHEEAIGRLAIEAALGAGQPHFVYHSVLHPQIEVMPHHWHKMRVEEMLFASGLPVTLLQPAAYMQNILGGWQGIVAEGVYRVPYPKETVLSLVDLADVAEAAALVLTEPGHRGAAYELAGLELLSQVEVAAVLSWQLGRTVAVEEIPLEAWRQQARAAGLGAYQVDGLERMFAYYGRHGFVGNGWVLEKLLGRRPCGLAAFVARVRGGAG